MERLIDHKGREIPPEVCSLFESMTMAVVHSGFDRYSADAILHRIRWHKHIEKGDRDYKCNDHWTAPLARWFLKRHPELPDFFEIREKRACSSTVEPSAHNGLVGGSTPSEPTKE